MRDAWLDLVLGSRCAVCGAPGKALCRSCERALPSGGALAWPTPPPPGLAPPFATGPYEGALRALVLAHKEHARLVLAAPLGRLLAYAVAAACEATQERWPAVDLVPVPSHPSVVRARGHDPMLRTARAAAGRIRGWGGAARVRPLLRVLGRPEDQAGLDARARAANLEGRFAPRPTARAMGLQARRAGVVVLVDDVVTTGATLREAQRALEQVGHRVDACATVAATRRRPGRA